MERFNIGTLQNVDICLVVQALVSW